MRAANKSRKKPSWTGELVRQKKEAATPAQMGATASAITRAASPRLVPHPQ